MLSDGRSIPNGSILETDLCVVGAGVAGIALTREFMDRPTRVVLLEGGSLDFSKSLRSLPSVLLRHLRDEQALAGGKNEGHAYYPLRFTRARAFGGSSRAWAAHGLQARPLDAIDFEDRGDLPYHGWPFGRSELEPFYRRAQTVCGLGPFAYEADAWESQEMGERLPLDAGCVRSGVFQFGRRGAFSRYVGDFEQADHVELVLHGTAVNVVADGEGKVRQVECASLSGNRFTVKAKTYVLTTGAIENARLLLASNDVHPAGIGNWYDLVGRFFMEHPDLEVGFFIPGPGLEPHRLSLYQPQDVGGHGIRAMLRLSDEVLRRENLLNAVLRFRPTYNSGRELGVRSARVIRRSIHHGVPTPGLATHAVRTLSGTRHLLRHQTRKWLGRQPDIFGLEIMAEQTPNPHSRVRLGKRRDRLGVPATVLDWRLGETDWHSIRRTVEIMGVCLRDAGLGKVVSTLEGARIPPAVFGNWHQLGTTRMHRDPQQGVVDEDCRVHEMQNLYVAGGSVFPTGGYANPTLTIVALALRLADHLQR